MVGLASIEISYWPKLNDELSRPESVRLGFRWEH